MQPQIRKVTFIVRLWTDGEIIDVNSWRGTADRVGSGQSRKFETLTQIFDWMRQELAMTEDKLDP